MSFGVIGQRIAFGRSNLTREKELKRKKALEKALELQDQDVRSQQMMKATPGALYQRPPLKSVEQSNNETLENNLEETQIETEPVVAAAGIAAVEKLLQNLQKPPIYPTGVVLQP
ncbi:hypothetical protein E6C27_scaffold20G001160 [Cucumis melo var. makuwa]|uniref:Uncharacterized protein n=1 Tax=Cucumis melo var. makuwa TaxID=1194695 RepID=A0A5A7T615_CUCMM|nr:hypothetical protein E6C27_scaffold20G001160 [Cucumis melo var. makuwa]